MPRTRLRLLHQSNHRHSENCRLIQVERWSNTIEWIRHLNQLILIKNVRTFRASWLACLEVVYRNVLQRVTPHTKAIARIQQIKCHERAS